MDQALATRKIQVLEEAGGWIEVLNRFKSDHISGLGAYAARYIILLIDFDAQEDRLDRAREYIPEDLRERVFVIGVWTEPEDLRKELGSYESIGKGLARACREDTYTMWNHVLLKHNIGELERLRKWVRPILFGKS